MNYSGINSSIITENVTEKIIPNKSNDENEINMKEAAIKQLIDKFRILAKLLPNITDIMSKISQATEEFGENSEAYSKIIILGLSAVNSNMSQENKGTAITEFSNRRAFLENVNKICDCHFIVGKINFLRNLICSYEVFTGTCIIEGII